MHDMRLQLSCYEIHLQQLLMHWLAGAQLDMATLQGLQAFRQMRCTAHATSETTAPCVCALAKRWLAAAIARTRSQDQRTMAKCMVRSADRDPV